MELYNSGRSPRRARRKALQPSCDVVGMLPTEEAELRRALYASLMPKNPKTKKTSKSPNLTGVEFLLGGDSSASGRLKSPEMIYDLDSKSPSVTVLESLNESQPASPLSCHSTTPLNLFLSSSSWSTTDSSPSCDSSLSSWSPGVQDRERGNLPNKKKNTDGCKVTRKKGSKEGKRDTVVATKSKIEPPPNKRRKKINQKKMVCDSGVSTSTGDGGAVGTDGGAVGTDGGAVGTDGGGVGTDGGAGCDAATGGADPSTCTSIKVQAQRKFPANQNPPTRRSHKITKAVRGLKKPPKTEDFITYLCLRGSSSIPKHLHQFETPWTKLKKQKVAKTRTKDSKK